MTRRLEVFHHRSLRRILGINMRHVQELRISNERIRQHFQVPEMICYVQRRQLQWLFKIANMSSDRLPPRLLESWIHHPRSDGRPQLSYRNSYATALHDIIPEVDPTNAKRKDWISIARNKVQWTSSFKQWWESKQPGPPPPDDVLSMIVHSRRLMSSF